MPTALRWGSSVALWGEQKACTENQPERTMKRALGYFGMALAGGLLALGIHDYISPSPLLQTASTTTSPPAKFVSMPGAGGNSAMVPDFVDAAERSVNAVVHVTVPRHGAASTYDGLFLGISAGSSSGSTRGGQWRDHQ
jgi:hypothetical protein